MTKVAKVAKVARVRKAFGDIKKIRYEGPKSTNPLSFKHYNARQKVEGKTMAEHLRSATSAPTSSGPPRG